MANDDLMLKEVCGMCLNPHIEDPWRHVHEVDGEEKGHWHHRIDPGDGLVSRCLNSDMLERLFGEQEKEIINKTDRNKNLLLALDFIMTVSGEVERDLTDQDTGHFYDFKRAIERAIQVYCGGEYRGDKNDPPVHESKIPPRQRLSDGELEELTSRFFGSKSDREVILVSEMIDVLSDLSDMRSHIKSPGNTPEERVEFYLEKLYDEFSARGLKLGGK